MPLRIWHLARFSPHNARNTRCLCACEGDTQVGQPIRFEQMTAKKRITYRDMVAEIAPQINECFPWDVKERLDAGDDLLFLDVRENQEYDTMHIEGSLHVPRGILETAVEWDHEETEPELVEARDRQIVVVCRSGSRSVFAAYTLMQMGYEHVTSLKTGLRGWNEYDMPLVDMEGNPIDPELGDRYFANKLLKFQHRPENARF